MVSDTDLRHVGVRGMKWGIRKKSSHEKALGARTKAELAKLDISKFDQNAGLKRAKANIDPTDKFGKKHLKLEERAVRADQKARRLETISKYSAPKPHSSNDRDNKDRNSNDRPDNDRNRNDRPNNDRPNFDRKPPSDRAVNQIARTPYNPKDNKKNEGIFQKAVSAAVVNATGTVGTKYGEQVASRIITRMIASSVAAKAAGKTPSVLWSDTENIIDQLIHYTPEPTIIDQIVHFEPEPTIIDDILHYGVKGMKWDESKKGQDEAGALSRLGLNPFEIKGMVGKSFDQLTPDQQARMREVATGLRPTGPAKPANEVEYDPTPMLNFQKRKKEAEAKEAEKAAKKAAREAKKKKGGSGKKAAGKKDAGKKDAGKKDAGKTDAAAKKAAREAVIAEKKKATIATAKLQSELRAQKVAMDKLAALTQLAVKRNAELKGEARNKKVEGILGDPNLKRSERLMRYLRV